MKILGITILITLTRLLLHYLGTLQKLNYVNGQLVVEWKYKFIIKPINCDLKTIMIINYNLIS